MFRTLELCLPDYQPDIDNYLKTMLEYLILMI